MMVISRDNIQKEKNDQTSSKFVYELGDANLLIDEHKEKSFDLVITSPPYNVGKEYETKQTIENYLKEQEHIITKIINLVSERGSICWQVGNYIDENNKEVFPLDIFYYQIFKKKGLFLKNRIIWHFGHGLHATNRFSGRYETILWFTKSATDYIFNLDTVRVPSKYPGKRHYKGPKKGELSGNPKGKNPSDFWDILYSDWDSMVWEIPNVKANHPEKSGHPCQFPIELVERCILALTNECSWILDPYAGVGSTLIAAIKNHRNVVGFEINKNYIDIGLERIRLLQEGKYCSSPIGKPLYDHTKSKLSIMPEEFKK